MTAKDYVVTDLALVMGVLAETAHQLYQVLPLMEQPKDQQDARALAASMTSLAKRIRSRVALAVTVDVPFEFSREELVMTVMTLGKYLDKRLSVSTEYLDTPRGARLAHLGLVFSQELDWVDSVSRETSQESN